MITLAMLAWPQNSTYVRFLHMICVFINNFVSLINAPISAALGSRNQKLHVRSQLAQRPVSRCGLVDEEKKMEMQ
jgi:hypothetical protein